MNNSICTLFDNILIDIHKFKSLHYKKAGRTMCFVLPRFFIDLSRSYNYFFCASASFSISFTAAASCLSSPFSDFSGLL